MLAQAITLYKHGRWRVGLVGFCGANRDEEREREKSHSNGAETKGKEKREREGEREKERGHCGLRLKRSIHPSAVTSAVPCPLFSPFSIPFTGMPPQRTTRMDLVFRVCLLPIAASDLSETIPPTPPPPWFRKRRGKGKGREKRSTFDLGGSRSIHAVIYVCP